MPRLMNLKLLPGLSSRNAVSPNDFEFLFKSFFMIDFVVPSESRILGSNQYVNQIRALTLGETFDKVGHFEGDSTENQFGCFAKGRISSLSKSVQAINEATSRWSSGSKESGTPFQSSFPSINSIRTTKRWPRVSPKSNLFECDQAISMCRSKARGLLLTDF